MCNFQVRLSICTKGYKSKVTFQANSTQPSQSYQSLTPRFYYYRDHRKEEVGLIFQREEVTYSHDRPRYPCPPQPGA
ncbi:hypothetical protein SAMN05444359_10382 [Neolewinella agarilytica]|uniref:Uncharacterized protein n=1 Tax=Neolewinella agarilytica TaxID=478744 RepID=A0A1H9BDH6_9BACT|nr:hypothetical protein SAMN05444359_10382 [Neolewinella agarilytica]